MKAKLEMKVVRDWIRHQVKSIKADPYLANVSKDISIRIVKWNQHDHSVLVCARDLSKPETPYNSEFCRWTWVHTWVTGQFQWWKWNIWREVNEVVNHMQYEKNHS